MSGPETLTLPPPATDPGSQPAITVRGLRKRYGGTMAVQDLSMTVPRGGIFGLIGPNGAGKTTTMLSIATLLPYDAGDIRVLGHDPSQSPFEVRRNIGWMPDFFGVYDGLTCHEYLDFFAASYQLTAAERTAQIAGLLELVNLAHKRDTDVSGLSRGMQQRLSLARALVHDPQVLILDEPASGLDPRARVELREILLELGGQGRTILVSSHILAELEEMCDRVAIMESGRVLAQGTPDEIRAEFLTAGKVTIRILGDQAERQRATDLCARAGAAATLRADGRIIVELTGGDEEAADLLQLLVGERVRIHDFREERGGLEHLFMTVTKGVIG
ncbi:MAG: ABC transporter ATP-binding protein [Nitriliruptorales bacterium]|nr:ABC transporter ATP-binding protein [Nitriliruptorales bacterium]